jgi:membrane protein implicated in regulation of membrane protease activity
MIPRPGGTAYVIVAGESAVVVCFLTNVGFLWTLTLMVAAEIAAALAWVWRRRRLDDHAAQLHGRDGRDG